MQAIVSLCLLTVLVNGSLANAVRLQYGAKGADLGKAGVHDTITLEIPVDGRSAVLQLHRSDAIPADVPVLLATDRNRFVVWENESPLDDFVTYLDPQTQASFLLWNAVTENHRTEGAMGMFNFRGNTYTVEPMDTRMEWVGSRPGYVEDENSPVMIILNGVKLSMRKVDRKEKTLSDTGFPLTSEALKRQEQVRNLLRERPEDSTSKLTYEVEVLVVLDYSVFMKWVQKSRSLDYKTKEAEAINHIRYYFAEVLSGVGLRYGVMSEGRIRLRPVAFYIAKSEAASYWTEMPPFKRDYHFNEASGTLKEFAEWLHQHDGLPSFDYAVLFTENALLAKEQVVGRRLTVGGLSDVMGVCQYSRVSVCHDGGLSASVDAASWELGNSLGAYSGTLCEETDDDGKAEWGDAREVSSDYPLRLPECSKRALWGYLYHLNANGTNCLLVRNNHTGRWDRIRYLQLYSGQRYTPDEQCKLAHGMHSFSCTDSKVGKGICAKMHCWIPFYGRCQGTQTEGASDGTPCGNNLWCMNGQCVLSDGTSNSNNSWCLNGDYKSVIDTVTGYKCYEVGIKEPHRCYDHYFRLSCCDTCSRVKRSGRHAERCEFGNRDPTFCRDHLHPSDCYDPKVADKCCESCGRYRMKLEACEYGDKSRTCQTAVAQKFMCYDKNNTCCLTCPRLQVGVKGCEWGDRMGRCRGYPMNKCYDAAFSYNCCDYCSQLKIGPAGCEWGDRVSSCTGDDCLNPKRKSACCKTCSSRGKNVTVGTPELSTESTTDKPTSDTFDINLSPSVGLPTKRTSSAEATAPGTAPSTSWKPSSGVETNMPPVRSSKLSTVASQSSRSSTVADTLPPRSPAELSSTEKTLFVTTATVIDQSSTSSPTKSGTLVKEPSSAVTEKTTTAKRKSITVPTITEKTLKSTSGYHFTNKRSPSSAVTSKTTAPFSRGEGLLDGNILESDIIYVEEEPCEDRADFCYQIRGGFDCYSRHGDCCATCKQFEDNNPTCPYGNKISWCERYVTEEGKGVCDKDPFIRSECCASCNADLQLRVLSGEGCQDKAGWCAAIFAGQCYDSVTRRTCCAKCSSLRTTDKRCIYGDVYSWCSTIYCETQARECCQTCKHRE